MRLSIRWALLVVVFSVLPPTEPARSSDIVALAPFEVLADGFVDAAGIAIDSTGAIFVTDRHVGTVTRVTPDLRRTTLVGGLSRPTGLTFDDAGRLLVAEENADRVIRLASDGRYSVLIGGLKAPRWLAVGETGVVYVSARRLGSGLAQSAGDTDSDPS